MNKEEAIRKINKAKIEIMTRSNTTFMSFLLSTLKIIITNEVPTLGTDGKKLLINPEFIKEFNLDELIFCLMHETMHVAYQHMDRKGDLDPMLYNIAGDYVINLFLKDCNFTILDNALIDEQFREWSTLKVYEYLLEQNKQVELPWKDIILSESSESDKEEIIGNIIQAKLFAEKSNDPGSIPVDLKRELDKLTNPKLPWNTLLQKFMFSHSKDDFSWRKPNRRYWPNTYVPTLYSESMESIYVIIDVSGSISQDQLNHLLSETRYIQQMLNPTKIRIICFDAKICYDKEYAQFEEIDNFSIPGGGGTMIGPVMDILEKDSPKVAVIMTDGEFHMPYMEDIHSSILWIINNPYHTEDFFNPPKGEVIYYE